jgi:hypothetical protein
LAPSAPPVPSEPLANSYLSSASGIGSYTKAAALASLKRKSSTNLGESASSGLSAPSAPTAPVLSDDARRHAETIQTLARAVTNLEQRLRMNEDAVADLRISSSGLGSSLASGGH